MLLHYLGLLFMVDKIRSPVRSRPSVVAQMVKKKKSVCHAGDLGLIPGSGRYPGEGNGYPL